jgi:2-succinyl-5-enolpyruvyl-6-hydroxy-3-cyclohexene-1-carboxylate synthase
LPGDTYSPTLIKHYAQDLGFKYLSASSKKEYLNNLEGFLSAFGGEKSIVFEVFTDSDEESRALELIRNSKKSYKRGAKVVAKKVLGERSIGFIKKALNKS